MFDYSSFYYKETETNFRAVLIDYAEMKKSSFVYHTKPTKSV